MSSDVWIGTVLSIPVSLGVALATPSVQGWLAKRGQASHAKRRDRMRDEYNEVLHYALHTDLLLGRMLVTIIVLLILIVFLLVGNGIFPLMGDTVTLLIHPSKPNISKPHLAALAIGLMSISLAVIIPGLVMILKATWKYVNLFFHVRFFESYVESIPIDLRDRELETIVICAARERAVPTSTVYRYKSRTHKEGSGGELEGSTDSPL